MRILLLENMGAKEALMFRKAGTKHTVDAKVGSDLIKRGLAVQLEEKKEQPKKRGRPRKTETPEDED